MMHRYYKLHGYETTVVSGVLAVPLIASDVAEVYRIVYDYSK